MLTLAFPPAPATFDPVMPPKPEEPPFENLSPRHQQQYRQWTDDDLHEEHCDPEVILHIRAYEKYRSDKEQWYQTKAIQREAQWAAAFFEALPAPMRALLVAAPIHAALLARDGIEELSAEQVASIAVDHAAALIRECSPQQEPQS